MKLKEVFSKDGELAEFGRLTYICGVAWKRVDLCQMGLAARAEGLIGQNPERKSRVSKK